MFEPKGTVKAAGYEVTSYTPNVTREELDAVADYLEPAPYVDFYVYNGMLGKFTARWHSKRVNMLHPGYYYAMITEGSGMGLVQLLDATNESQAYDHAHRTAKELNMAAIKLDVFYCMEAGEQDAVVIWGGPYNEVPSAVTFEQNGHVRTHHIH